MEKITKEFLKDFRKKFKDTLSPLEKELGVSIELGKTKYSENEFDISAHVIVGDVEEVNRNKFINLCRYYNLNEEDYLKRFTTKGKTYEIIGFDTNRRKYSYKCRDIESNSIILFTSDILDLLN